MSKVGAVIRREFVERVRRRSFWVMAMLGPVFFAAIFLAPLWFARGGGLKRIAVVDRTTTGFGCSSPAISSFTAVASCCKILTTAIWGPTSAV